jgi:hypothetical protein
MGLFSKYQSWVDAGTDDDAANERASQRQERRADQVEKLPGKAFQNEAARLRAEAEQRRRDSQ